VYRTTLCCVACPEPSPDPSLPTAPANTPRHLALLRDLTPKCRHDSTMKDTLRHACHTTVGVPPPASATTPRVPGAATTATPDTPRTHLKAPLGGAQAKHEEREGCRRQGRRRHPGRRGGSGHNAHGQETQAERYFSPARAPPLRFPSARPHWGVGDGRKSFEGSRDDCK
jgi:hypothetical protein